MFEDQTPINQNPSQGGNAIPSGGGGFSQVSSEKAPPTNLPLAGGDLESASVGDSMVQDMAVPLGGEAPGASQAPKANNRPAYNQGPKVEDIFAGTEKESQSPQVGYSRGQINQGIPSRNIGLPPEFDQIKTMPQGQVAGGIESRELSSSRKFLIIILSLVMLGALGAGGFFAYKRFFPKTEKATTGAAINTGVETNEEPVNTEVPSVNLESNLPDDNLPTNQDLGLPVNSSLPADQPPAVIDNDNDGLSNDEEAALGTNFDDPDTDKDNLPDLDEVKVYQTDPLNPDTDGDSYLDGDEVKNGYNPNGTGKLFNLP